MLSKAKLALRLTTEAYDEQIEDLIKEALADLRAVGISEEKLTAAEEDDLIRRAVITFVRVNFGSPDDYDRLKASYDEQKGQLQMASGYGLEVTRDAEE